MQLYFARNKKFLSTPSGWRATARLDARGVFRRYFYPRPPGGGRRVLLAPMEKSLDFYPRPPGGGRLPSNVKCSDLV